MSMARLYMLPLALRKPLPHWGVRSRPAEVVPLVERRSGQNAPPTPPMER